MSLGTVKDFHGHCLCATFLYMSINFTFIIPGQFLYNTVSMIYALKCTHCFSRSTQNHIPIHIPDCMNSEWSFHVRVKSLVSVCPRVSENAPQEFPDIFAFFFDRTKISPSIQICHCKNTCRRKPGKTRGCTCRDSGMSCSTRCEGKRCTIILLVISFAVIVCNRIFAGSLPS